MPRFTKYMADALKSKMLERLDTKAFTKEDIQEIIENHMLNDAQIKEWIRQFRYRYGSKSKEEIEAFLRNEEKVRDCVPILGVENFSTPGKFCE